MTDEAVAEQAVGQVSKDVVSDVRQHFDAFIAWDKAKLQQLIAIAMTEIAKI